MRHNPAGPHIDPTEPVPVANRWIALHRASLIDHIEQCVPRGAGQLFDRFKDTIRALLTRRFLTTVCSVSMLLVVPLLWLD
jgi:hypothetical protein